MEKVYFLLRNNLELGPFTKRQLLKQSLQPKDLVWVEGESVSWQYPSELAGFNPQPGDGVKSKKRKALSTQNSAFVAPIGFSSNHQFYFPESNYHHDAHSSLINLPGGDALELIIHKKNKQTISWDGLIGVAFATLLVAIAWHGRQQFFTAGSNIQVPVVKPVASISESVFRRTEAPSAGFNYTVDTTSAPKPALTKISTGNVKVATARKERVSELIVAADPTTSPGNAIDTKARPETIPPVLADQKPLVQDADTKAVPEPELETASSEMNTEATVKKKGLGKTLKGLFKKKKKAEEINIVEPGQ